MTQSEPNTTDPEQIEAQASADHERRIEEAERRVIAEVGVLVGLIKRGGDHNNGPLKHYSENRLIEKYDALNALTTPVESIPEKVDEWEGWEVYEYRFGSHVVQIAEFGSQQFTRDNDDDEPARPWRSWNGMAWVTSRLTKFHGPERLAILRTLPPGVRAAKGVDCGN